MPRSLLLAVLWALLAPPATAGAQPSGGPAGAPGAVSPEAPLAQPQGPTQDPDDPSLEPEGPASAPGVASPEAPLAQPQGPTQDPDDPSLEPEGPASAPGVASPEAPLAQPQGPTQDPDDPSLEPEGDEEEPAEEPDEGADDIEISSLGLTVEPLGEDQALALETVVTRGALVVSVRPGSAAEWSGLLPGDVVIGLGDATVSDARDLDGLLDLVEPGTELTVDYVRNGVTGRTSVAKPADSRPDDEDGAA